MAYAALWFSFKVPQNSPREKIERPGLFYSKLNTFIYGVYMYGSIVQQFIVDYRAANRMHANQDGMLRQQDELYQMLSNILAHEQAWTAQPGLLLQCLKVQALLNE